MHIALVLALLLSFVTACSKKASPEPESSPSAVPAASSASSLDGGVVRVVDGAVAKAARSRSDGGPPVEFTGTLRGVVKLAKGSKLPLAPFPVLSGVTPPSVAPCPSVDATDQKTVTLAKQTAGLSPIHVAITGMSEAPPHEPVTHDLFIDACRLRPGLVAAVRGDFVRVTNRSDTALVPRLPGTSYMRGLLHGESQQAELKKARTTIDCTFGSWCGDSLIVATTHALAAVTTPEGFFTIEHVPLDQKLTVHAWNPLFELTSEPFTLTHQQSERMIELTLKPTANAAATKLGPLKKAPTPAPALPPGQKVRGPDDI